MKLGLDLHGVISDIPDTMKMLTEAIISSGGEVHIITGSVTDRAKIELSELGFEQDIHYTHVMGISNYLEELGYKHIGIDPVYGNKMYLEETWNMAKAVYCGSHEIQLHLDDTVEYGEYFVTPFARLWTKNK